jgi:CRISPR-associated protein (TIGR03984 family)
MMKRNLDKVKYTVTGPNKVLDPIAEINDQLKGGKFEYLLAHADDGVIWGIVINENLTLSSEYFPEISPKLRSETLREVRLFGQKGEWFLWQTANGLQSREIIEGQGEEGETISESLILWGTDCEETRGKFSLVREADMGIRQALPMPWNGRHKNRLLYKHYLDYDKNSVAYIKLSRLVDLINNGDKR